MKIVDINNKLYIGKDSERNAYLKYIEYFNTFVKENKGSSPNTTIIYIRINNK